MTESVVSVQNVSMDFGDIQALRSINVEVPHGVFGLIGPNGAGKTTLLRILLGLIRPAAGTARVLGLNAINDSLNVRKRIGALHEHLALPKSSRSREYLQKVINLYDCDKSPDELLKMVGLEHAGNQQIGTLSAGMQQRLGIALAFAGEPELIFLDEPTSNLDVGSRDQIIDLILDLHQSSGVSFVISSHVLSELERVCSHVAFINLGRVVEQGEIQEVIEKHTAGRYRIRCSDARRLFAEIQTLQSLSSLKQLGTTLLSVTVDESLVEETKESIKNIAATLGVKFYGMELANTLEDAFRAVI